MTAEDEDFGCDCKGKSARWRLTGTNGIADSVTPV